MTLERSKGKSLAATMGTVLAAIVCVMVVVYMFSHLGTQNRSNTPADQTQTSGLTKQQRDKTPLSEGPATTTTTGTPTGGGSSDSTRAGGGPSATTENTGAAPKTDNK